MSDAGVSTRPMRLSAARKCANTPLAPTSSVPTAMRPASPLLSSRQADAIMLSMPLAASRPTRPSISPTICPRAASTPKTVPASAMAMTSRGAIANIE